MKKKIISLLLAICLVLSAAPVYAGAATGQQVTANAATVTAGNTASVTLKAENFSNVASMEVYVYYDPAVFTLSSTSNGSLLSGAQASVNTAEAGTVKLVMMSLNGISGTGNLLTLYFKTTADCTPGTYPITVAMGGAYDTSLASITIGSANGSVTVNKPVASETFTIYCYPDKNTLQNGDILSYRIANGGNRAFVSGEFLVEYDPEVFAFDSVSLESQMTGEGAVYSVNSSVLGQVRVVYANDDPVNCFYMFTVKLKVIADTDDKTTVSAQAANMYRADLSAYLPGSNSNTLTLKKLPEVIDHPNAFLQTETLITGKQSSSLFCIEAGAGVAAADFTLNYDPAVLRCVSVTMAEGLSEKGGMVIINDNYTDGTIRFSYVNMDAYAAADLPLVQILWEPLQSPDAHYVITSGGVGVVDAQQNVIPLEYVTASSCIYAVTQTLAPTCTEGGYTTYACACGESYQDDFMSALGHSFTNYVSDNNAAAFVDGTKTAKCDRCDATDTVTDVGSMIIPDPVTITKQPESVAVRAGFTAEVTLVAEGDGLIYRWYYKDVGVSKFTLTTTFTGNTYSVVMDSYRDGRQIYCVVTDQYGNSAKSDVVTLSKAPDPVTITKQPISVAVLAGDTATVTFTAKGDGLAYKWYFKNKGASKFYPTSSFTDNSYSLTMDDSRDGRQVYCVVTDMYGNSVTTDTVTLRIAKIAQITKQPDSVAVPEGETAIVTFEATGDGLTYQWYFKNKGASKFYPTSSFTGNSYSMEMDDTRAGRQVYCVITDDYGNSVQTETVTLDMLIASKVEITKQPESVTVADGEKIVVSFAAEGEDLTYKWYYKNKGATKFSLTTTFKSNTYNTTMNASRDGRELYCVVTDKYGNSVQTDTVTINMLAESKVEITKQPVSVAVLEGETAIVTFEATGDGLTYQWHFKNAGASKFYPTSTFKSNSYHMDMSSAKAGRQVYCVITDTYGNSVTTDTVTLSLAKPAKITKQPVSVAVTEGEKAIVTFEAEGDGLTYQWYFKNAGASKFYPTSTFKSNSYHMDMTSSKAGREVYCVITDAYGNSLTTDTVTLGLEEARTELKITRQPVSVAVADGESVTVSFTAQGDDLTYKWYYKNKGASKFSLTTTFKSNSYNTTMNASRDGRELYCVVSDKYGNSVTTDTVIITIEAAKTELVITQQPVSVTVAEGERATVTFEAQGDDLTYKWYFKDTTASKFYVTGTFKSNTYSAVITGEKNGRQVYCEVTDAYGNSVTTDTVTITIEAAKTELVITQQPVSVTVPEGERATVTFEAQGDGLTYKWYFKDAASSKFYLTGTFKSNTYSAVITGEKNGRQVYCVVTDRYGNTVTTDTVTLTTEVLPQ